MGHSGVFVSRVQTQENRTRTGQGPSYGILNLLGTGTTNSTPRGVELVVPVPSRLRIPYDGPWPVRVRFSCVWTRDTNTPECPMRVYYDREGLRVEAALQKEINAIGLGSG